MCFIGMTPVPSATSASLPGSVIPSPSTSSTSSPMSSPNLWPLFTLAVVPLVLLIVAVAAIVYCKQRRRKLNLKPGQGRESPDDKVIETGKG